MGFGFRVMPGVRVRVTSRGVRTSLGPRAARVHVGAGRTTVSTGVGPVSAWTGTRRRSAGRGRRSYTPTAAELQQQAAAIARTQKKEERLAQIRELIALQHALMSAHLTTFVQSQRPVLPTPEWVRPEQYLPDAERRHLAGVRRFDKAGRQAAQRAAQAEATDAAARYNAYLNDQHRAAQSEADRWWHSVIHNDPDAVLRAVNEAFADNESPAAALSLDSAALLVVMIQPSVDEFGDQKASVTPAGNPTIARMNKTEQRQQWTSCTLSRAIATIAEAFATAPAIARVNLAVVCRLGGVQGDYRLVLTGDVSREHFQGATWPSVLEAGALSRAGNFVYKLDRFASLSEIPTVNDPQLQDLVNGLNGVIDDVEDDPLEDAPTAVGEDGQMSKPDAAVSPQPVVHLAEPVMELPHDIGEANGEVAGTPGNAPAGSSTAQAPNSTQIDSNLFQLWGSRGSYCNLELKGTEHRQDAILALLPRRLGDGAELDAIAQLLPEPTNPFDRNAVACHVADRLIGYLPKEEAVRYAPVLAKLVASGRIPVTRVHLWAREFDDYEIDSGGRTIKTHRYYTSARIALAEPHLVAPINLPPSEPRVELPDGGAVKIIGTQEHLQHLLEVLGDRETAWVHATLEPQTLEGARSTKTVVQVLINSHSAGTLSPQMSNAYLPIIRPLVSGGCAVTARVLLRGSPVSVAASLYAARAHEIPRDWFRQVDQKGISLEN